MRPRVLREGGHGSTGFNLAGCNLNTVLTLNADPVDPMQVATAGYINLKLNNLIANDFKSGFIPVTALPAFTGDLSNEAGSNILTLADSGVSPGVYTKFRVDAKGRIINGYQLTGADLPAISFSKITSNKPNSLAGYGISDAISVNGGTVTGKLTATTSPAQPNDAATKGYADSKLAGIGDPIRVGSLIRKATAVTPAGFFRCNGGDLNKSDYPGLYAEIGDSFSYLGSVTPGSGTPWKRQFDFAGDITCGAWSAAVSTLPVAKLHGECVFTTSCIHYIGGHSGIQTTVSNSVYTAYVAADGTIGGWANASPLPGPTFGCQAVAVNNKLYVIGGSNGSVLTSKIYVSTIDAEGRLGAWSTHASTTPEPIAGHSCVIIKDRLYVIGGTTTAKVYYSVISPNGDLGPWIQSGSLPDQLSGSQAIITKDRIYMVSGATNSVATTSVYTATINPDGSLGAWVSTTSFPVACYGGQSVVGKNRVYVFVGIQGSTESTAVYTAVINADGTLGAWTSTTALSVAVGHAGLVVSKKQLIMVAGWRTGAGSTGIYVAATNIGLDDYSPYYNGSIAPTNALKFRLPYTVEKELPGSYTYIKV